MPEPSLTPPSWRPRLPERVREIASGLGGRAALVALAIVVAISGVAFAAVRSSVDPTPPPTAGVGTTTSSIPTEGPATVDPSAPESSAPPRAEPSSPSIDLRGIRRRAARLAQRLETTAPPLTLRIGSFNILGTQHTAPGGKKGPGWPSGAARLPGAVQRIQALQVSIVGLQEAQPDQIVGLMSGTGFAAYPGSDVGWNNRVNSILYDPALYDFVSGTTFLMSNGRGVRVQPILRLRDKLTQREFLVVNTHPPAGRSRADELRRAGTHRQLAAVVRQLLDVDLPLLMTGDMNDREAFASRVLRPTGLIDARSATGYSGPMPVDWIAASPDVVFSAYGRDTVTTDLRISDHFFVTATAIIGSAD